MSPLKPFPAITGGCVCNLVRYRLLTSPLYVCACHCANCQKATGSAFSLLLNIEVYNIRTISPTAPITVSRESKESGVQVRHVECPTCKTKLWSDSWIAEAVCDLQIGTLDFPSLMEPDIHIFVDSKLDWMILPEGAKTIRKNYILEDHWPKSSLKRLEICKAKAAETKRRKEAALTRIAQSAVELSYSEGDDAEDGEGEGEKTPTAVEPGGREVEDDEAFERRFRETEKALQQRLDKLSLKLQEEEVTENIGQVTI